MIEIEVKYQLKKKPEAINSLLSLGSKIQSDIYYDTNDCSLIKQGHFMRVRNEHKLEFKIDLNDYTHLFCKELSFLLTEIQTKLTEINNLFEVLCLPKSPSFIDFNQFIEINNFHIIAPIKKRRTMYSLGHNCNIFIDDVDNLGLFLEAEIMVDADNISSIDAHQEKSKLINLLMNRELITSNSKEVNVGYVELYLLKHNKHIYDLGKFKL